MTILLECTELASQAEHSGIQRVTRNLAANTKSASMATGHPIQLVAYLEGTGLVKLEEASPEGLRKSIGSLRFIASRFRAPRRFRRLCNAVLASMGLPVLTRERWKGPFSTLRILALLIPVYGVGAIAFLSNLLMPRPRSAIDPASGDVLVIPGWSWIDKHFSERIEKLADQGVAIVPLIHDLIPITHPDLVLPETHTQFRDMIIPLLSSTSLVMANSQFTAREVEAFMARNNIRPAPPVASFRMGIELDLADNGRAPRKRLRSAFAARPPYLTVGTIEPKKNLPFLLDAFERLWERHPDVPLVVVGRIGWNSETTCARLRSLIAAGHPLHWFSNIEDHELSWCYRNARALIYPSMIEGFGLPLLEALLHGCPVLASDIPVFHEIGEGHCRYFPLDDTSRLCQLIEECEQEPPPRPQVKWPDWRESALEFFSMITSKIPPR